MCRRRLGLRPSRRNRSPLPWLGGCTTLRHAAVSLWLNSGVPATAVAERAGHSVKVPLQLYAKCIDGQQDRANKRINDALDD